MTRLHRVLVLTFLESFATVLFERGVYFYTHERLGFGASTNLALAAAFGAFYIVGALASHRVAHAIGEKRLARVAIVVQLFATALICVLPLPGVIFAAATVLGLCNGAKWPVVESYVGAGRNAQQQAQAVGYFNTAWSLAVPSSLLVTGVLVAWDPPLLQPGVGLFLFALACNVVALFLLRPLPDRPAHLAHDHPHRPDAARLALLRPLLTSSRWWMLASYSLLFTMAPLMPIIFANLGHGVIAATCLSAVVDVVRVIGFVVLQRWTGWHGRVWPLVLVALLMPTGFYLVVLGPSTAAVLCGEVVFGVAAAVAYYAGLYYAVVVKNASVDAGGVHESLIGGGFLLGPLTGLAAEQIAKPLTPALGLLLGPGSLIAVCAVFGCLPLRRAAAAAPPPPAPAAAPAP